MSPADRRRRRPQTRGRGGGRTSRSEDEIRFRAVGPLGNVLHGVAGGPERLREAVGRLLAEKRGAGANLLILLRRIVFQAEGEAGNPGAVDASKVGRAAILEAVTTGHAADRELCAALRARRDRAVECLKRRDYRSTVLLVNPVWRLVVGLSAETPLEVGIALHGTYGLPVLPATSLKGLAKRGAALERLDARRTSELFGSPGRQGSALLLDGLPEPPVTLCLDVMTPHVGEYYQNPEDKPPAEYWQPVPVTFLAVPKEVSFTVHVLARDKATVGDYARALRKGLEELGAGAKTAAGYGYCEAREDPGRVEGGER